ncbi:HDOD domain-containing protein [bacterium]|nr:HDOD domain-containing protein [bacterium]
MTTSTPTAPTAKGWRAVNLDVLQRIDELPSLSSVVAEFLELSRQDFFTAQDFEQVLRKDQALVARLLKVANSAFYGRPRRIHSIPEAVVLVGLEQMKRIVFAVSAEGLTRSRLRNYHFERNRGFWMHSTAVGLAARAIADASPGKPLHGEEAFVAGLLHDVGKLIIDDFLDREPGPRDVSLAEEAEAVGLDHAELAEYILGQWRLPDSIVAAVRDHHRDVGDPDVASGAPLLQLAGAMVATWRIGRVDDIDLSTDFDAEPHRGLLTHLGFNDQRLAQAVWDVRQHLAGIESLYFSA